MQSIGAGRGGWIFYAGGIGIYRKPREGSWVQTSVYDTCNWRCHSIDTQTFQHRSHKKKLFSKRTGIINPAIRVCHVDISKKQAGGKTSFEVIAESIFSKYGFCDIEVDQALMRDLDIVTKDCEGKLTVFVWMEREIAAIQPGWTDVCLGMSLDIGTTTVALYLCDLVNGDVIASGSMTNPQIPFGTDVMSRIAYSAGNPGEGVRRMREELIKSVNALISQLLGGRDISPRQIMDMTVVGNTVMHHIFLGIAPDDLGLWPFAPTVKESVNVKARGSWGCLSILPRMFISCPW